MKISTLTYSFKQGIKNIKTNKLFTTASISTIAICILVFGMFYAIVSNARHMVEIAEKSIAISVFFNEGISSNEINAIGDAIRQKEEILEVKFISAEEAWEKFKKDNFEGNESLVESFGADNPLADSASYEVKIIDISKQQQVINEINAIEGVRKISSSESASIVISSVNLIVGYVSILISGILLFISIFLISNTVIIGISVRKDEIAIMKLIGATDTFIRAPFIVEGMIIGFIGAIIPMVVLYFGYQQGIQYIFAQFGDMMSLSSKISFIPVATLFKVLIPISILIGVVIGFIGSFFTLKKHLKV